MKRRSWVRAEAIKLRVEDRLSTREIARRLKSHAGTVSRWMKDLPLTPDELAQRLKAACKKAGVTRSERVLKKSSSGVLLRRCSRCGRFKDATTYARKANGGLIGLCPQCKRKTGKEHYRANKVKYKERSIAQRKMLKKRLDDLKACPCTDCGKQYPPYVMDFDHCDPALKIAAVSSMLRRRVNWEKILAEIKKCEIVCSNCHRIRTFRRYARA